MKIAPRTAWAVASLVLGIVSIAGGFAFILPPILALLCGCLALRRATPPPGSRHAKGLAIAGMILGSLSLIIDAIWLACIMR